MTYETPEQAHIAWGSTPHVVDNKVVDVKKAEPQGSPALQQPAAYAAPAYASYAAVPKPVRAAPGPMRVQQRAPRQAPAYAAPPVYANAAPGSTEDPHSIYAKCFIGGLTRASTEDSVTSYFSNFGTVVACEVMRRNGVSRGFGFVIFARSPLGLPAAYHSLSTETKNSSLPPHLYSHTSYPTPSSSLNFTQTLNPLFSFPCLCFSHAQPLHHPRHRHHHHPHPQLHPHLHPHPHSLQ